MGVEKQKFYWLWNIAYSGEILDWKCNLPMIGPNIDMIPFEIEATKDTVTLSEWKNWIRGLNNTPPNVKPNPSEIYIKINTKNRRCNSGGKCNYASCQLKMLPLVYKQYYNKGTLSGYEIPE